MYQAGGGSFYVAENEMVVDPFVAASTTPSLSVELLKCEELVQRDFRYAQLVAGASKMPMGMIWVSRNQDQLVTDADLAALKDIAWTELVKKRYLPGLAGTTTVRTAAASMLEIVREMNLQRRRFLIMGLHEQVEASEIQLVLHLCQAEIIHTDNYRATANRYRRHDKLFEAFALAVGAFVCASAPYTLGSGTTRYERDLQFEYKKTVTALFVWALRKVNDVRGMDEDYVARISRLIVVKPDDDGDDRRVGFLGDSGGPDTSSRNNQVLLDAVAEAQNKAETALTRVVKLGVEGKAWMEKMAGAEAGLKEREAHMSEKMDLFTEKLAAQGNENVARVKLECEEKNKNLERTMRDLYSNGLKAGGDSNPMDLLKQEIVADLGQSINAVNVRLATSLQSHTEAMTQQIQQLQQGGASALAKIVHLSGLIKTVFSYLGSPLDSGGNITVQLIPGQMTECITTLERQVQESLQNSRANAALIASLDATVKATDGTLQLLDTSIARFGAARAALQVQVDSILPRLDSIDATNTELEERLGRAFKEYDTASAGHEARISDNTQKISDNKTELKASMSQLEKQIALHTESNKEKIISVKTDISEINELIESLSVAIAESETTAQAIGDAIDATVDARLTEDALMPLIHAALERVAGGRIDETDPRIMLLKTEIQAQNGRIDKLEASAVGPLSQNIFNDPAVPTENLNFQQGAAAGDPSNRKRPASARP